VRAHALATVGPGRGVGTQHRPQGRGLGALQMRGCCRAGGAAACCLGCAPRGNAPELTCGLQRAACACLATGRPAPAGCERLHGPLPLPGRLPAPQVLRLHVFQPRHAGARPAARPLAHPA
jgi:hypothetical protein